MNKVLEIGTLKQEIMVACMKNNELKCRRKVNNEISSSVFSNHQTSIARTKLKLLYLTGPQVKITFSTDTLTTDA